MTIGMAGYSRYSGVEILLRLGQMLTSQQTDRIKPRFMESGVKLKEPELIFFGLSALSLVDLRYDIDGFFSHPPISLLFLFCSYCFVWCVTTLVIKEGTDTSIRSKGWCLRSATHHSFSALHRKLWSVICPSMVNSFKMGVRSKSF
jgi:hypothetical protein